jgi:hypothetical protein
MAKWSDIIGVYATKIQFGIAGLNLKTISGKFRARNAADNTDVPIVGSIIASSGDSIEINEDASGTGADRKMTLSRPLTGMTADVNYTLPPTVGASGQVLSTDGSSGTLSWQSVATGSDQQKADTTTIAFGASSPVTLFTLPANAVIVKVMVIVDSAFNGAPTLSIGIPGTTSKYMGSTEIDLTAVANTVFEKCPGLPPVGSTEALIATYAAGGASAGSARVVISYVIPS